MINRLLLILAFIGTLISLPAMAVADTIDWSPPVILTIDADANDMAMPVMTDNDMILNDATDPLMPDKPVLPGAAPLDRTQSTPRDGPYLACYLWDTETCVPRSVSEGPVPVNKV